MGIRSLYFSGMIAPPLIHSFTAAIYSSLDTGGFSLGIPSASTPGFHAQSTNSCSVRCFITSSTDLPPFLLGSII